jgi:hypothetical protein
MESPLSHRSPKELLNRFERFYKDREKVLYNPPDAMITVKGKSYTYYEVSAGSPLLDRGPLEQEGIQIYSGKIIVSSAVNTKRDGEFPSQADLVRTVVTHVNNDDLAESLIHPAETHSLQGLVQYWPQQRLF